MPSITTQNVAAASATLVPTPSAANQQVRQGSPATNPAALAQASKIAADQQSHLQKRADNARSLQVPKRTEGAFSSQQSRTKVSKKKQPSDQDEKGTEQQPPGMDVVA